MSDDHRLTPAIRVLIADDHQSVRDALAFLLQTIDSIQVVAEAHDGIDAVEKTAATHPQVVLMDVRMPRLNGIDATRRITRDYPRTHVLAMLMAGDTVNQTAMLDAGAVACVDKAAATSQIVRAIHTHAAPAS